MLQILKYALMYNNEKHNYSNAAALPSHDAEIRAVIFDMDGILLDTEKVCDRTWEIAARDLGLETDMQLMNDCRGTSIGDSIKILANKLQSEDTARKFLARTSELFHEIESTEGLPVKPFAAEILRYLQERGYALALASSTRSESVRRQLATAKLIDFFETLTTGDMVLNSKPDPEIYIKACASVSCAPVNCVAVEDSLHGIKSAVGAGMRCIMVPDIIPPTDEIRKITWHIFDSLDGLRNVL